MLKARKRLKALGDGAILQLLADDPAAVIDVPQFCNEAGHALLSDTDGDGHRIYLIRKGRVAPAAARNQTCRPTSSPYLCEVLLRNPGVF